MVYIFKNENVEVMLHKEYTPKDFALDSLFYYKKFYQLRFFNEYSNNFNSEDSYYFFYVISGSVFITLDNKVFSLTKNDLLVVKKNTEVKLSASKSNLYVVEFDGKLANDYISQIVDENHGGLSMIDFSNIVMFFVRLKELSEYENKNEVYISLNLEAILVEIYSKKYYGNEVENPRNYAIIQALFYVEQNISNKITLDDLCEFVGYSVFHFSRLFKKEVGMPPYDYIIKFRLDLAKHLLITTGLPVKDIAKECGYHNEINFYNIFKKKVNMSPKQFRKSNKEKS